MKQNCGCEKTESNDIKSNGGEGNDKDQSDTNYNDNNDSNSRVPTTQSNEQIAGASRGESDVHTQSKPFQNGQDAILNERQKRASSDDYSNRLVRRMSATTSVIVDQSGGNPKVFSVPRCTSDEVVRAISNRRSTNVSTLSYC